MENLLRNGVDLQSMYNAKTINGDAHFFEDVTTPAKVRQYLDSFQASLFEKGIVIGRNQRELVARTTHSPNCCTNLTNPNVSYVSEQEADKIKGMKLLLAMLSKGKDIPEFFPDVVKNVVARGIEVKKMVYIYLVHYADFNDSSRDRVFPVSFRLQERHVW